MRVLVCGGRDYTNQAALFELMDRIHGLRNVTRLIQGGAKGADFLAKQWAFSRGVEVSEYAADWSTHGKAAGHIRNKQMLEASKPDIVVAFPGGKGTANMVEQSKRAGLKTLEVGI